MRYPASEKLEIIRTVEASHLPVKQTLAMIGKDASRKLWRIGLAAKLSLGI